MRKLLILALAICARAAFGASLPTLNGNATNLTMWAPNGASLSAVVKGTPGQASLEVDSILTGPTQANTFSWDLIQGTLDVNGVGSVDIGNRGLQDSGDHNVLNWGSQQAYTSPSSVISIDWGNRLLETANGGTVDWANCFLEDLSQNLALNWNTRQATAVNGSLSVDWQNRDLVDLNATNSIAWGLRIAYQVAGQTAYTWSTGFQSQNTVFGTAASIAFGSSITNGISFDGGKAITLNQNGSAVLTVSNGIVGINTNAGPAQLNLASSSSNKVILSATAAFQQNTANGSNFIQYLDTNNSTPLFSVSGQGNVTAVGNGTFSQVQVTANNAYQFGSTRSQIISSKNGGVTFLNASGSLYADLNADSLILQTNTAALVLTNILANTNGPPAIFSATNGVLAIQTSQSGTTNVFDTYVNTNGDWNMPGVIKVQNGISSATTHTPVAVTVGASPFTFTCANSVATECYFSGATAYSITKNGAAVFGSLAGDCYFVLQTNSSCVITYTVAPTMFTNAW